MVAFLGQSETLQSTGCTEYPVGPETVIVCEIPHANAKSDTTAWSIPSGADLLI